MSDTFLKEIVGHRVYVTKDGRFTATIGRMDITRKTLRDLEREVAKRTAVRVLALLVNISHPQKAQQVVVVSCENDRFRTESGDLRSRYDPLYRHDEDVYRQLLALYEEYEATRIQFVTKWQALTEHLRRLDPGEWSDIVTQYQVSDSTQEEPHV